MSKKKSADQRVVNIVDARSKRTEERRREYERVLFRYNFRVYVETPEDTLHPIEIVDISQGGMQFQTETDNTLQANTGDRVTLRFYFAEKDYLAIDVIIKRILAAIEQERAVQSYGCSMDEEMPAYTAINHYVQFLTKCAEHGRKDDKKKVG